MGTNCGLQPELCALQRASTSSVPEGELTTEEAKHFIDEVVELGKPILILSGGEPLTRPDVFEIARYGTDSGLRVVLATNGTLLTPEVVKKLRDAGCRGWASALTERLQRPMTSSAACPELLTGLLQVSKSSRKRIFLFRSTQRFQGATLKRSQDLWACKRARSGCLPCLFPCANRQGEESDEVSPADYERVLHWFYNMQKESKIQLKATCAPHYFRIMRQRAKKEGIEISVKTHGYEAMTKGCLGGTGSVSYQASDRSILRLPSRACRKYKGTAFQRRLGKLRGIQEIEKSRRA